MEVLESLRRRGPKLRMPVRLGRVVSAVAALLALVALSAGGARAQTISGRLMEVDTDQPIQLGLILMFTEEGDSVTFTITDERGDFMLRSSEAGSFILEASAFGYRERRAGIFELGTDGAMEIEFRLAPQPMPIDEVLVALDRPALEHSLIRNGFVRRLQRGLGHFITPAEIERSPAMSTPDLFYGIPGLVVAQPGGGLSAHLGDHVQMRSATGLCTPDLYVDGIRVAYSVRGVMSLDNIVPLEDVDAVEVYRRAAEVPLEYGGTQAGSAAEGGLCGVLVFWTRRR